MSVVAVIPARGGSKGLPNKNILDLGGRPLIAWTIEAARQAETVDRVIVNTDSPDIQRIAIQWGADVPFLRPEQLATDTATTEAVLQHADQWLCEHDRRYEILVYLQPTDPFRRRGVIDQVVTRLGQHPELDSVFAAHPEHKNYWSGEPGDYVRVGRHNHQPRQCKTPLYREDTGIALATRMTVIRSGRRIGERVDIVPHETHGHFVDIHDEFDLWLANQLILHQKVVPNE